MKSPRRVARCLTLLVSCALVTAAISAASSGSSVAAVPAYVPDPAWELDTSFGDSGLGVGPVNQYVGALATTGDETVFAGSVIGRFTATGGLDPAIGGGRGFVPLALPGLDSVGVSAMVIDDQGRVVVAGYATRPGDPGLHQVLVARFTPDLQPDTTFGDGGSVLLTTSGGSAGDVQLQPDGDVVVTADADPSRFWVARLTPAGVLDGSFGGGDGIATIAGGASPAFANALSITSDAKIVLVGAAGYANGSLQGAVAQLLPSGAVDPAFGTDGVTTVRGLQLSDVVRLPTGSLAALGLTGYRNTYAAQRLVQISKTGRLISWPGTTNVQRTLVLDPLEESSLESLALQHDGKLVMAGGGSPYGNDYSDKGYLVVRARADGSLDPGFGERGHVLIPWRDETDQDWSDDQLGRATAVGVDDRDRVVVGGEVDRATDPSTSIVGVTRFAATSPARTPVTELRETNVRGAWHRCGTTSTDPCPDSVGTATTFGGRVWPAPDTEGLRLQVQRLDASDNTTTPMSTTPEGNFRTSITPTSPGHYRARVKVPDSGTTLLTAGAWRYFEVTG